MGRLQEVTEPAGPLQVVATSANGATQATFALPGASAVPPQPVIAPLSEPITPTKVTIRNTSNSPLILQGLSLIDRATHTHTSITVSPAGDFRRIHSGDVKVYERLDAPGRAWLVHGVAPVGDAAEAQAAIADPGFAPRAVAVIEAPVASAPPAQAQAGESVTTVSYADERQTYQVDVASPGLLVVADAWYPGWHATVDGQPAEILRANLLYRAVALEPGRHEVTFEYAPKSWRTGLIVSGVTALLLLGLLLAASFIRLPAVLL